MSRLSSLCYVGLSVVAACGGRRLVLYWNCVRLATFFRSRPSELALRWRDVVAAGEHVVRIPATLELAQPVEPIAVHAPNAVHVECDADGVRVRVAGCRSDPPNRVDNVLDPLVVVRILGFVLPPAARPD